MCVSVEQIITITQTQISFISYSTGLLCLNKLLSPIHFTCSGSWTACVFVSQGCWLEAGFSRLDGTNASDGAGQCGLREIGRQNLWWEREREADRAVPFIYWHCCGCKSFHCVVSSFNTPPLWYSSIPRWPSPGPSRQFILKQTVDFTLACTLCWSIYDMIKILEAILNI